MDDADLSKYLFAEVGIECCEHSDTYFRYSPLASSVVTTTRRISRIGRSSITGILLSSSKGCSARSRAISLQKGGVELPGRPPGMEGEGP